MKGFSRQFGTRYFSLALATFFLLVSCAAVAFGQAETGQIKGKVTDPNGAVVPNATVTVKSVATGAERTATADSDGVYIVTSLQPGLYDVTFQGGSFAATTQRVEITTGARVTLDQKLGLQGVTGTVNVVASTRPARSCPMSSAPRSFASYQLLRATHTPSWESLAMSIPIMLQGEALAFQSTAKGQRAPTSCSMAARMLTTSSPALARVFRWTR